LSLTVYKQPPLTRLVQKTDPRFGAGLRLVFQLSLSGVADGCSHSPY
jgi:hypothetical protein